AVGSADNAASIAGMLLTTECVLCDIKEPVLWRRLSRQPPMPAGWCAPWPKWSEPRHGRHGRYVLSRRVLTESNNKSLGWQCQPRLYYNMTIKSKRLQQGDKLILRHAEGFDCILHNEFWNWLLVGLKNDRPRHPFLCPHLMSTFGPLNRQATLCQNCTKFRNGNVG
ncbi:MAG: hypothetical protein IJM74_02345, partial [Bacteroidales bacterium]|nr:hypothetical protein [Bacteroidales bacterium]